MEVVKALDNCTREDTVNPELLANLEIFGSIEVLSGEFFVFSLYALMISIVPYLRIFMVSNTLTNQNQACYLANWAESR